MKANTALGLALSGASLWLLLPEAHNARRRISGRLLASIVTLMGGATLVEYLFGLNLRIDQLLFRESATAIATYSPGRMAPTTTTAFLAIGISLLLLDARTKEGVRLSQLLSLWSALVSVMAITGYLYKASALYSLFLHIEVPLHTALTIFFLSGALFFARTRTGIARDVTAAGSGSVMARRLLPPVFFIPLLLGWISLRGEEAGFYQTGLSVALYATATILLFVIVVWSSARKMNVEYHHRNRAEREIRQLNADLEARVRERTKTLEEQATVLSEQAALLDLTQDAIFVRDMKSRISFWNRAAAAMYGWSAQEAVGRLSTDLLGPESSESDDTVRATLLDRDVWEREAVHRKRDGSLLRVSSRSAVQRDGAGSPLRILTTNNDITAQRQIESHLRQAQKMEAVGQLAAGVAHEFNNLLQALMSMATIVRLRSASPEVMSIGGEMEQQIRLAASLTEKLLVFSHGQVNEKTELDLRQHIRKASDLLLRLIPQNIRIVTETPPEALLVESDGGQIQQMLLNLAINARDAMPSGGMLTLRAGSSEGEVFFEVEDTGEGMDAATCSRIFEPFFTTKEQGKGTGLGLSVVHGIVQEHGGRVDVQSRLGEGSRFRVTLPASLHQRLPERRQEESGDLPVASGRVLVVEDQEGVREGIVVLLDLMGYEVIAVESGEEALSLKIEPPPDLLLSDITLPGIPGPEVGRRLSERWPALKVVLMSGFLTDATRAEATARGWHFLQKPFELEDLAAALQTASESSREDRLQPRVPSVLDEDDSLKSQALRGAISDAAVTTGAT